MAANQTPEKKPSLPARLAKYKTIAKLLTRINVVLYRLSSGRITNQVDGCPVCLLTMTGRKSGKKKTIALMYTPFDSNKVLLVASLGGAPKNPLWYYNLAANPNIIIQEGATKTAMTAKLSTVEERPDLWKKVTVNFPPYTDYQARTEREIPVFICSPK